MRYALTLLVLAAACSLGGCDDSSEPAPPTSNAKAAELPTTLTVDPEHRDDAAKEITRDTANQKLDEIEQTLNKPMPEVGQ